MKNFAENLKLERNLIMVAKINLKFFVNSILLLLVFILASCTPLSENSDGGIGGNNGSGGGSYPESLSLTPFERQILGKYSNGSGKSLEFSDNKRGEISSSTNPNPNPNPRAAFSEITSGNFSWSVAGNQITLVMDNSGDNFTATFNPNIYSIEISGETFRLEGAPLEIPPDEIPDQSPNAPTLSGEINLEKREAVSRLVIVSAPAFSATSILKTYINHKKTQGFDVVHLPSVGETDEAIRSKLKDEYQKCKTADKPMAVLLVGDMGMGGVSEGCTIPARAVYNIGKYSHPTDFHYGDFDDDWVQEVMVGRFSVQNEPELTAQVDKIIHMENGTLDGRTKRIVRTSAIYGEGSQCIDEYLTSIGRSADLFSDRPGTYGLFDEINRGAGLLVYSGHGVVNGWHQTLYSNNAASFTNKNVFPVVIASTCLSGSYQSASLGEAFINNSGGGAVAYIGASAISYEYCNQAMVSGNWRGASKFSPGMLGSLYHDISQSDIKYRVRTLGGVLQAGYRALRYYFNDKLATTTSDMGRYSIEIYNLLGDPTYMPYTDAPQQATLSFSDGVMAGRNFAVYTSPEAQVALTREKNGEVEIIATALANESGRAVLTIPADAATGIAKLCAIAPNYYAKWETVNITDATGEKSNVATLQKIDIYDFATNQVVKTIAVENGETAYEAEVDYEQNPVKISVATTDSRASVFGEGIYTLGDALSVTPVSLKVTAENGTTTNIYMLNIKRNKTTKSNDWNIKTLKINNDVVTARIGDPWYYDYNTGGKTSLVIDIEMNNENAKCWIEDVNNEKTESNKKNAKNTLKYTINNLASWAYGDHFSICVKSEFGDERAFIVKFK